MPDPDVALRITEGLLTCLLRQGVRDPADARSAEALHVVLDRARRYELLRQAVLELRLILDVAEQHARRSARALALAEGELRRLGAEEVAALVPCSGPPPTTH
jgi:hypothetical protein